jgi:hypothetical protein
MAAKPVPGVNGEPPRDDTAELFNGIWYHCAPAAAYDWSAPAQSCHLG